MAPPTTGLAEALARLAQRRDPDAWAAILDVAGEDCWRCCLAVCGRASLAEDAFQDALLQIRDHADQFRIQGADADTDGDADALRWVKRVATTTALQLCRARGRARQRDHRAGREMAMEVQADPGGRLHAADDLAALRETLASLDEPRRTAITLHHLQGMPLADVATELGRPVGTVKTWIHRGLEELHTLLASRGVSVSATSLVALFLAGQASAAGSTIPAGIAATAPALVGAKATAGASVITLTATGTLPMAVKAALAIAVAVSAAALPVVIGQEGKEAPPAASQQTRPNAVVIPLPAVEREPVATTSSEEPWRIELRKQLQTRVSLNHVDETLMNVVGLFRFTGINIVVAPDVAAEKKTVTVQVKDMRVEDALTWICTLTRTHWAIQERAIVLSKTPILDGQTPVATAPVPVEVGKEPWRVAILAQLEQRVTLTFDGKDLVECMDFIRRLSRINIVIDPAVVAGNPPQINLKVQDMRLQFVLDYIMRSTSLKYVLRDEAIFITRP